MVEKKRSSEDKKSVFVGVRFTPELARTVDKLAKLAGTNRSDILRRLVSDLGVTQQQG